MGAVNQRNCTSIYALVLAAGRSSRFGRTKQLEELDGLSLVRRAVEAATVVCGDRLLLVAGHDWRSVAESGLGPHGFLLCNENHDRGLGTSLALGVRALRHTADAILVLLADQPLVNAGHLRDVVDAWSEARDEIVATASEKTVGPPVLFPAGCFDDLARLEGDSGGKRLLTDPRFRTTTVTFEPAAIDIDTPDDLARL